jgi:hypothetical protein
MSKEFNLHEADETKEQHEWRQQRSHTTSNNPRRQGAAAIRTTSSFGSSINNVHSSPLARFHSSVRNSLDSERRRQHPTRRQQRNVPTGTVSVFSGMALPLVSWIPQHQQPRVGRDHWAPCCKCRRRNMPVKCPMPTTTTTTTRTPIVSSRLPPRRRHRQQQRHFPRPVDCFFPIRPTTLVGMRKPPRQRPTADGCVVVHPCLGI